MSLFLLLPGLFPRFLANIQAVAIPPVYVAGSIYLALLFIGTLVDLVLFGRFLALPLAWDKMATRLRSRPWLLKHVLWIVLTLILIQLCAGIIHWGGGKMGWLAGDENEASSALLQGILLHGVALLIIMVFIRRQNSSWKEAFGMNRHSLRPAMGLGLISYVGVVPVVFVISLLYQLFLYAAGYPLTLQDVIEIFLKPQSGWSLFFLLLLATIIAPFVEETLFRGMLLPALMKKMSMGTAIVISSAFFAGIHQHLPSMVPLFVLAVVLSLLYIYSGSLWAPIILHALFNGVSICLLLLTYSS